MSVGLICWPIRIKACNVPVRERIYGLTYLQLVRIRLTRLWYWSAFLHLKQTRGVVFQRMQRTVCVHLTLGWKVAHIMVVRNVRLAMYRI